MTPAQVQAYNAGSKFCLITIPGQTDGSEDFLVAEIGFPVGDKSEHTDIRILAGDRVWVQFINGDPRFPLITHYRPRNVSNVVDFRRFHHANIETDADATQKHTAGSSYTVLANDLIKLEVGESSIELTPTDITLKIGPSTVVLNPAMVKIDGPLVLLNTPVPSP